MFRADAPALTAITVRRAGTRMLRLPPSTRHRAESESLRAGRRVTVRWAIRFQNIITIDRSPGDVFAYLADFEKVPTWNYAIAETGKISEGPVGVGTRYRQVRKLPRPSEESFEVTEFQPEARLSIEGTFGRLPGRLTYVLEPVARGTRVTNEVGLQPTGVLRLVSGLATSKVRSAVGANLRKLKELLEGEGPSSRDRL
jgi:hypothetical protein